jgi:hypothetical protein
MLGYIKITEMIWLAPEINMVLIPVLVILFVYLGLILLQSIQEILEKIL